jgi:hypothetical protein
MSLFKSNQKGKEVNSTDTAPCASSCNKSTVAGTTTMNKAEIIAELENMIVARLFSRRPWLADREACSAISRKLIQMGLVEVVCDEPETWRATPLGKELDIDLLQVFMGHWDEYEVPMILEDHHLLDEGEADALYARMDKADAESVLIGCVKRAYFDYHKAAKYLH